MTDSLTLHNKRPDHRRHARPGAATVGKSLKREAVVLTTARSRPETLPEEPIWRTTSE
jgi:hypothetical protein